MSALRAGLVRLASLFGGRGRDREMEDELESHLQLHVEDNVRAGMSAEEARRDAVLKLGGLEPAKELWRERRGVPFLEHWARDLTGAARRLLGSPGFTAVALLTLALGTGANAALFSLVDAVLLQSLPVRSPEDLVALSAYAGESGNDNGFSYPMYKDLRDQNQVFSGVLARGGAHVRISHGGASENVGAELVSGNYFEVLGVRPALGRLLSPDDDRQPGAHPVVVISYRFWQRRFGSDPGIVGQSILLNDYPMTVLGVTASGFYGTEMSGNPDVQIPMMETLLLNPVPATRLSSRRHQWLTLMARRKEGVSLAQAQASLEVLYRQVREGEAGQLPAATSALDRERFLDMKVRLSPGRQGFEHLQRELRGPMLLLFAITGVVLLIVCANLANLWIARAAARSSETAVRLALGASRGRIAQQWLAESLVLSLAASAGGGLVAVWARAALVGFMPAHVRANLEAPPNWTAFAFLLLVAVVLGAILGLAPALSAAGVRPASGLSVGARASVGGGVRRVRGGLIVLQIALSLPLLVGAGLLLRSLDRVYRVDAGFERENLLLATVNPAQNRYPPERARSFCDELTAGLRALPGVRFASLASDSPISGGWDQLDVVVEGYTPSPGERVTAKWTLVGPDYFRTLGTPLAAGREFTSADVAGSAKVVIVNRTMARQYFGDADPIGRKIGTEKEADAEIVGVVGDAKQVDLREAPDRHFYEPLAQAPRLYELTLHVRTAGDPGPTAGFVRSLVARLDAQLPLYNVKTLAVQVDESLVRERLLAWLSSLFGLLATALAAVGLYGVVALSVTERTREIGIRMALGARPAAIMRLVGESTGAVVGLGVGLGLLAAAATTRLLTGMLFEVPPADPFAFAAGAVVLAAAAGLATWLPARRAVSVDPVRALRWE